MPRTDNSMAPYRAAGLLLVFAVFLAIVIVLFRTLVFDRPLDSQALVQALIAAGVGVTVTCLLIWVLDLLQLVELRAGWAKLLWGVLIASVLGNSALVYGRWATQPKPVSIKCLRPLVSDPDTKIKHPYAIRSNTIYARGDLLAMVGTLDNAKTDNNGDFSVDLRFSIEDRGRMISVFSDYHFAGNRERIRTDPAKRKTLEELKSASPECVGTDTLAVAEAMRLLLKGFPAGGYVLRATAYDRVNSSFSTEEFSFQLNEAQ